MKKNKILSVIILSYNEKLHIKRCIESLSKLDCEIFVVDSFSTDNTVEVAKSLGATVLQNAWVNYATQFNWALENCPIDTPWVMRVDADEYLMPALVDEINARLHCLSDNIAGIYVKRRIYFMGRWIKHGDCYPIWHMKIWRRGKAYCEKRWMDEHMKLVEGKTIKFSSDIVDENLNNLTWWTTKHNGYATREAIDILNTKYRFVEYDDVKARLFGSQEKRKRKLKDFYARLPLFIRPFLYFFYRYFIRLGFLDGIHGLIWHFLQGFWYRFLTDAKIYDIHRRCGKKKSQLLEFIHNDYEVSL